MTDLERRQGRDLEIIAGELRYEVEVAEQHAQSAVAHAIRAGQLLTEAKSKAEHGEWLPWLKANFPGSERTAQNYIRLAAKSATVADLPTIREAVAAITAPTTEENGSADQPPRKIQCPHCGRWVLPERDHKCPELEHKSRAVGVKPYEPTSDHQRKLAQAAKRRVEGVVVGTCGGWADGLGYVKVDRAVAAATQEEIDGWLEMIRDGRTALESFEQRLRDASRNHPT